MPIETTDLAPRSNAADLETRDMLLNIGPAHPAMHGIIRIVAKLDGERIHEADVEIGYLHRGFEKMSETVDYNGVIPYTDRLNYVSPLINNMGYCMTVSYCRVGGVKADLPGDFAEPCRKAFAETRKVLAESDGLLTRNRIFVDRMSGTGVISAEDAISYGITGPFLRATGADYDVRKDCPYSVYDRLPFDVPVGTRGDNMDRYLVRMEEMEQSMRIVARALRDLPPGPVQVHPETGHPIPAAEMVDLAKVGNIPAISGDSAVTCPTLEGSGRAEHPSIATNEKRVFLPPKEDTYGNIEGLMQQFKLVMFGHGVRPPKGEVYFPVEGANGELGFYVVSDGAGSAYRVRVRPPCFAIMSALPKLLIGDMIADMTPTFGSINMIGGELDR